jgi:RND family efflux transporter MFP subunit
MNIRRLLFCLALATLLPGCSEEKQETATQPQEPPPLPVETILVKKEKVPLWLEYTGKTEAKKRVEVRARVQGRLEQILFEEGDWVEEGQPLFLLEEDTYIAALEQAKAERQRNRATLLLAQKDVERYKPLVAENLAPRVTLEQYEAQVAELEASIQADEATIRDAQLNLSYTKVLAPISGRVSRRQVDIGNIVGYGEQTVLTTIVNDETMYAYFNPTESQFQAMRNHKSQDRMDALVKIPGDTKGLFERPTLRGKVDFTDNRVDRMTGTITMRAEVANPDHSILEGTFVYVEVLLTDEAEFLLIPPGIVQEDQRGSYIYMVDENQKAKRVEITGGYESRYFMMVLDGLQGGEQIIISGFAKLQEGGRVDPEDMTESKGIMAVLRQQGMLLERM